MTKANYPKRLIEVDLPIRRISEHARREKSIRHGHISTLHIWWARRPLAACRAVLCASLWPDPVDALCPQVFRDVAAEAVNGFSKAIRESEQVQKIMGQTAASFLALEKTCVDAKNPDHWNTLRYLLLDFIAEFAAWEASTEPHFLETARKLTQAAHEALGGAPGTRPLVVDPFAGGGSIPLEALRIGADAFASDLNPVAVLLNKVVLEYIPKYGQRLADEVRKWGQWIKEEAEKELAEFYPKDPDGATPIAYLWARTITCEGPGCGAEVPLMRGLWLAKKADRSIALKMNIDKPDKGDEKNNPVHPLHQCSIQFVIVEKRGKEWICIDAPKGLEDLVGTNARDVDPDKGTVKRGSAICPVCGYTTPVSSVRLQLKTRRGGAADARMFCMVTTRPDQQGRFYRLPTQPDSDAVRNATKELERRKKVHKEDLELVPDEPSPQGGGSGAGRAFSQRNYGMDLFEDLFTPRQALALTTLARLVRELNIDKQDEGDKFTIAIKTCLALAVDRQADFSSSLCSWWSGGEKIQHTFARQALPMIWDFAEGNPWSDSTGCWNGAYRWGSEISEHGKMSALNVGHVERASAIAHPLPDDAAQCFFTDPPYYDSVPYADLSDFFYVWLRRTLPAAAISNTESLTPKSDECIVDEVKGKDRAYFESTMAQAMQEGRRVLAPDGVGVVVFAHKSTSGWEAQLQAMVDAGWVMTGSWPIDTEMGSRLRAMNSAALASSVHLVCRPRPDAELAQSSSLSSPSSMLDSIGDWRDILRELPVRIHEWLPRLADEGVVGADAIFACLGPALEIFSRHSQVEKASGEVVTLREYLEEVWAAVSKEALTLVFKDADTSGFEEDARLTAMWLWTLGAAATEGTKGTKEEAAEEEEEEEEEGNTKSDSSNASCGYTLEYDAARKIAQGLGARLEVLTSLVEVKGDKATLLPVLARTRKLFGKEEALTQSRKGAKKPNVKQMDMFVTLEQLEMEEERAEEQELSKTPPRGATVLDRVHQTMILFSAGRSEAMKRFLVEDGIGNDARFWSLAQALSALYPANSNEKRWVDGILARKKGLGL